jgi:hypothetical protein
MSCDCVKAKKLPSCTTSLTLGTADAGDYYVLFRTPDGHTDLYEATADAYTGYLTVEDGIFRTGTQYTVWASLVSDENIETRSDITIGEGSAATVTDCILLEFTPVFDVDGDYLAFVEQTITLE